MNIEAISLEKNEHNENFLIRKKIANIGTGMAHAQLSFNSNNCHKCIFKALSVHPSVWP